MAKSKRRRSDRVLRRICLRRPRCSWTQISEEYDVQGGMDEQEGSKQGGTPARTKGARRATGESAGSGGLAPGQRWSAGRKREVVLRILRGEPLDALSRELGVEIYRLEEWRDKALSGMDASLKDRQDDPISHELDAAKRHIGELSMENELLRTRARALEAGRPLPTRRSRQ